MKNNKTEKYITFLIYFVVVVLINLAGVTLFYRMDITKNKVYSLSEASINVVKNLSEPLNIKVFFTKDLPAPHNNSEKYLHDLLEEYSLNSNKFFNYTFYNVNYKEDEVKKVTNKNQELASSYGISPMEIRLFEEDEIKIKKAYMGLVIIHGDVIEKIPAITSTENLEYQLTMTIKKLNNKISALANLSENINVNLYLSSSLITVAPYMGIDELPQMGNQIKKTIENLNRKTFGKINFVYKDPSNEPVNEQELDDSDILTLSWPDIPQKKIPSGNGSIGMIVSYKEKKIIIPLLDVMNIPIFGTQYQLINMDELDEILSSSIDSLIDINDRVGYLSSNGTLKLTRSRAEMMQPPQQQQQQQPPLQIFNKLLSDNYSIKEINLSEESIPESLKCLIIANPTKKFSDYDLFQIDQALMSGVNLAIFADPFNEIRRRPQFGMPQGPVFVPVNSGLEELLEHYGIKINKSYVMDDNSYTQIMPKEYGGGKQKLYFAPMIQNQNINKDLDLMKYLKGLITMRITPLTFDDEKISENKLTRHILFTSSKKSWEMRDNINLNPKLIKPPVSEDEMSSKNLASVIEGEFKSYFNGKPIPERESKEAANPEDDSKKDKTKPDLSKFQSNKPFVSQGKNSKIFVIGTAELLKDNMLDPEGISPNATFIMNVIDSLNNRDDITILRGKKQSFNPLNPLENTTKFFVKAFNIGIAPFLTVLFGLIIWAKRRSRKSKIEMIFQ